MASLSRSADLAGDEVMKDPLGSITFAPSFAYGCPWPPPDP